MLHRMVLKLVRVIIPVFFYVKISILQTSNFFIKRNFKRVCEVACSLNSLGYFYFVNNNLFSKFASFYDFYSVAFHSVAFYCFFFFLIIIIIVIFFGQFFLIIILQVTIVNIIFALSLLLYNHFSFLFSLFFLCLSSLFRSFSSLFLSRVLS